MSKNKRHKKRVGTQARRGMLSVLKKIGGRTRPHPLLAAAAPEVIENTAELEAQPLVPQPAPSPEPTIEVVPAAVIQVLARVATNAWRAKIKMLDGNTGEPREEMKRVYRHIEAVFESLKDIGVEAIDPTGRAYDSGMALKVVSFEQTVGLSKEEITETIKPAVALQGRLIQMAEVIVGTP